MIGLFRALAGSFVGTLAFAALLQAPKRAMVPASIIGMLMYLMYWILGQCGMSDAGAVFVSAVAGTIMAQALARRLRMVATIYILLSIVAAVPGLGLFRFMAMLGEGEMSQGASTGVETMMSILGIALGIAVGSMIFRLLVNIGRKISRK